MAFWGRASRASGAWHAPTAPRRGSWPGAGPVPSPTRSPQQLLLLLLLQLLLLFPPPPPLLLLLLPLLLLLLLPLLLLLLLLLLLPPLKPLPRWRKRRRRNPQWGRQCCSTVGETTYPSAWVVPLLWCCGSVLQPLAPRDQPVMPWDQPVEP